MMAHFLIIYGLALVGTFFATKYVLIPLSDFIENKLKF